jgi:plastocyanin
MDMQNNEPEQQPNTSNVSESPVVQENDTIQNAGVTVGTGDTGLLHGGIHSILRLSFAFATLVLVVGLTAYVVVFNSEKTHQLASGANAAEITGPMVAVTPNGLMPATIRVASGQEIAWVNTDSKPHHIVAELDKQQAIDSQDTLAPKGVYKQTLQQGTYQYYDSENPSVYLGTVIVN